MSKHGLNIIADIAGQYTTLIALLQKMPADATPVSIGDMVDRGPDSKRVLDFFMKPGNLAILGNHEDMMLDDCRRTRRYQPGIWGYNGGDATVDSFPTGIGPEYLDWLASLPKYIEYKQEPDGKRFLVSHAFMDSMFHNVEEAAKATEGSPYSLQGENSIIWNRGYPQPRKEYDMQICGHNSHWGLKWFTTTESDPYALCLDASRQKVLTGIHLPSMEIFQQEYI